jgi:hypothetical protein
VENCAIPGSSSKISQGALCWAYTASASTCSPGSTTDEACIRISGWMAPGTFTDPERAGDGQVIKPRAVLTTASREQWTARWNAATVAERRNLIRKHCRIGGS